MRQIFFDTETTGLSPESGDRIIEIGCVEMVNRRLTGNNKHFYLNPGRSSHEDAVKIHGLTDEFLADKPAFALVVDELLEYLADAEVMRNRVVATPLTTPMKLPFPLRRRPRDPPFP